MFYCLYQPLLSVSQISCSNLCFFYMYVCRCMCIYNQLAKSFYSNIIHSWGSWLTYHLLILSYCSLSCKRNLRYLCFYDIIPVLLYMLNKKLPQVPLSSCLSLGDICSFIVFILKWEFPIAIDQSFQLTKKRGEKISWFVPFQKLYWICSVVSPGRQSFYVSFPFSFSFIYSCSETKHYGANA